MGLDKAEANIEEEMVEEDDRIKFSRILAGLKQRSNITYLERGNREYKRINLENVKVQPSDVDDSFLNLMHEKAGGIPMYLTSITAWLIELSL